MNIKIENSFYLFPKNINNLIHKLGFHPVKKKKKRIMSDENRGLLLVKTSHYANRFGGHLFTK